MELKQLNKFLILLALAINVNALSQLRMADIENKEFSINLKTEKGSIIKIFEDKNYNVYYILDKQILDFDKRVKSIGPVNLIFFSKRFDKGILVNFKQSIEERKKAVYNVRLFTGAHDKYMFIPSMIILDKDFKYEYLMKYSYVNLPNDNNVFTSSIAIQNNKNRCDIISTKIKGNMVYENIDDILSNISRVKTVSGTTDCNPIILDMDLKDFFPKKIIK